MNMKSLNRWKLREIIVLSVLSVVFSVVYIAFVPVGSVLASVAGPIGWDMIFGIWFILSIIAAYIIRKPGAALISETIASVVEILLGNTVGPRLIISGIIQGLGAEAVFAATRYRKYSWLVLVAAGMGSSVFSFIWGFYASGLLAYSFVMLISMFVIRLISGAVIAGLLGKWIGDALHATGVLRGFAISRDKKLNGTDQAGGKTNDVSAD
jgi:energy-coupling factor transport system substrate-specific component